MLKRLKQHSARLAVYLTLQSKKVGKALQHTIARALADLRITVKNGYPFHFSDGCFTSIWEHNQDQIIRASLPVQQRQLRQRALTHQQESK